MAAPMKCTCGHLETAHRGITGVLGACNHKGYNPSTHEDWPCGCRSFVGLPTGIHAVHVDAAFAKPAIAGAEFNGAPAPIAMRIPCPECGELHIDEGEFATKPHHTHACQACGHVWRPAVVATVGVRFLPGFKNEPKAS